MCQTYSTLKMEHKIENITEIDSFFSEENLDNVGKYLKEAIELREKNKRKTTETRVGGPGEEENGDGAGVH